LIQGGFQVAAGKQLQKAANQLKQAQGQTPGAFVMPNFGTGGAPQNMGSGGGRVITGAAEAQPDQSLAQEDKAPEDKFKDDLGSGFAPGGNPEGNLGPAPMAQVAGPEAGGIPSGQGSVGGGGTGAGEQTGEAEQQPKYAANMEMPGSGYQSGGGGYASAGGGGRGDGGGPDLSGMLDKLMGKMGGEEAQFQGKPSLEDFGRGLASESYSYLDKSVNIFDRVHQAYQAKSKTGRVGL